MAEPLVSVIVVSWNGRELLAEALRSVQGCEVAGEVIVVDNGSTDGSAEMVASHFPSVRLLRNRENVGFGRANNQGMAVARGRYFFLLNSDARVKPGALRAMVAYAEAHPQIGVVGARLRFPDGRWQAEGAPFPSLWTELLRMTGVDRLVAVGVERGDAPYETDWVQGAAMLVRREVWEQVGGFDEGFFLYGEEVDWCARIKAAGWRIAVVPQAEVIHHGGGSVGKVPLEKRALVYGGKQQFFLRHGGRTKAAIFRALVVMTAIPKAAYWLVRSLLARGEARQRARQHAASYRRLLFGR